MLSVLTFRAFAYHTWHTCYMPKIALNYVTHLALILSDLLTWLSSYLPYLPSSYKAYFLSTHILGAHLYFCLAVTYFTWCSRYPPYLRCVQLLYLAFTCFFCRTYLTFNYFTYLTLSRSVLYYCLSGTYIAFILCTWSSIIYLPGVHLAYIMLTYFTLMLPTLPDPHAFTYPALTCRPYLARTCFICLSLTFL